MEMLEMKERYGKEELRENGGCIMVWKSENPESSYARTNAWEDMARSLVANYKHKVPYIKSVAEGTYYDGTRWLEVREQHGIRRFIYINH